MTAARSFQPRIHVPEPGDATAKPDSSTAIDLELVEQTRLEIQSLAQEIAEIARSNVPAKDFFHAFLPRVVAALGAAGGAVWTSEAGEPLEPVYQVNMAAAELHEPKQRVQHALLLQQAAQSEGLIVPPQSGAAKDEEAAGNPTKFLLLLAPLVAGDGLTGVVEILQRPGRGVATQRGYLRFVLQMAELATSYLKNQRLQSYIDRQTLWEQLERFLHAIHQGLDPETTAATVANEGRRLIGCDRVSVVLKQAHRWEVAVASGIDRVDRRSRSIKAIEKLASLVLVTGEALWFEGDTTDTPPQIEEALHEVVEQTSARAIAVVPLTNASCSNGCNTDEANGERRVLGAIVIEQFQASELPRGYRQRVEVMARHSAEALANALDHDGIFLMPLWKSLGKLQAVATVQALPKLVLAAAIVASLAAALIVVPADFEVEGRGTLQPVTRREVFAGVDGIVSEVKTSHGAQVRAGQSLVQLRSTSDLDVAMADLMGKQLATRERIAAVQRALLSASQRSADDDDQLSGQLFQLRKTAESIDTQIALYEEKRDQLVVASPIDGQVVTWQVEDRLIHRPVRKGQALLTVVDPRGEWELEVHLPEHRLGHVAEAQQLRDEPLQVRFMLATHPGKSFVGTLKEIHRTADDTQSESPTVLLRVAIDKSEIPELRPGSTVSARVDCGWKPIGYVWLHDVWEFVQSQILFRI